MGASSLTSGSEVRSFGGEFSEGGSNPSFCFPVSCDEKDLKSVMNVAPLVRGTPRGEKRLAS